MAEVLIRVSGRDGVSGVLKDIGSGIAGLGKVSQDTGGSLTSLGKNITSLGASMAKVAAGGMAAIVAGFTAIGAAAVKEGAAFTKEMSNVAAISGATGRDFENLTKQARQLGATTVFTAKQAAEGMSFLAMAGFEVNDIMGAMPGVLNLAAASNIELGRSADIVSNILSGFGASSEQTGRFVDVLTATFTSSNTSLEQLGQGMKFVAPVAKSFGMDVVDTAAAMGKLGDAGIQGALAGTSLRGVLLSLSSPSKKAQAGMKELGLMTEDGASSFFDLEGNMLPLPQIIGKVQQATAGLTQEQRGQFLKMLVGTRRLSAFNVLLEAGEDSLAGYGDELRDSVGRASTIAAKQLDNLSGDVTLFKSRLSGIKIDIFTKLEPVLRAAVQGFTKLMGVVGPLATNVFGRFASIVTPLLDKVGSAWTRLVGLFTGEGGLGGGLGALFASLGPEASEFFLQLVKLFRTLRGEAEGVGGAMSTGVTDIFRELVANIFPTLTAALKFVNENWATLKGVLVGVGAVLAGGVIAVGLSTIAGIIGALLSPVGLLIVAAGALGAAWQTNFMGIRDIATEVWNTLAAVFDGIKQKATELITAFQEGGTSGLLESLGLSPEKIAMLEGMAQRTQEVINNIVGFVQEAITGFQEGGTGGLLESLGMSPELIEMASERIKTAVESIKAGFAGFLENLAPLKTSFADFMITIQEALPGLQTLAGLIGAGLFVAFTKLGELLGQMLPRIGSIITGLLSGLMQGIGGVITFLAGAVEMIVGLFTGDLDRARVGAQMVIDGLLDILGGLANTILAMFGTDLQNVVSDVNAWASSISSRISEMVDNIVLKFQTGLAGAVEGINTWAINISGKVDEMADGLIKKFGDLIEDILETFTKTDWKEVGEDILKGLVRGIEESKGKVLEVLKNLARSALSSAKAALGIGSPSKDFQKIGQQIGEGLVLGLQAMMPAVIGMVGKMVGVGMQLKKLNKIHRGLFPKQVRRNIEREFVNNVLNPLLEQFGTMDLKITENLSAFTDRFNQLMSQISGGAREALGEHIPDLLSQVISKLAEAKKAASSSLIEIAQGFTGLAGATAPLFQRRVLAPMARQIETLSDQAENARSALNDLLGREVSDLELSRRLMPAVAFGEIGGDLVDAIIEAFQAQVRLNQATDEYNRQQQKLLRIQEKQQEIAFLQQQLALLDMIAERGLDPSTILGGLQLGINADLGRVLDVMSTAMQAIIDQVNADLQIASPSRLFAKKGAQIMEGLAAGIGRGAKMVESTLAGALPAGTPTRQSEVRQGDIHYHLHLNSSARTELLPADFRLMQAAMGARS